MISPDLLEIICCPETHQTLRVAPAMLVERLNEQIAAGALRNRGGNAVTEKLDAALVRSDQQFAYPVRKEIPILLVDEAISLSNWGSLLNAG